MRHDLIVAEAPTIPSLPAWARHFVTVRLTSGEVECQRALTEVGRTDITLLLKICMTALIPAKPEEALTLVAKLLLAFPAQELSETAAKYRSEGYLTALSEFPAWAIAKGCDSWLRREFAEKNDNYAFAPSPPQLSRLCRLAVTETRARRAALQDILRAKPDIVREITQAEQLRRAAKVQAMRALTG